MTTEERKPIRKFKARETTETLGKPPVPNNKEPSMPYIVRVKRRRDEDALDQICKHV